MPGLRDFLTQVISELDDGIEQSVYSVDASEDTENIVQRFTLALTEYFVSCWLSPGYGDLDEVWEKWNTGSHPERTDMLHDLRIAFCNHDGEIADDPDPRSGLTKAKGNFAETVLRWIEETFREGDKHFIPPSLQPSDQGRTDLVEIIFSQNGDWFAILWESKATEDNISGVVSDAYKQLDDYPRRQFYALQDRAASLKEDGVGDSRYANVLRLMPMLTRRRSEQVHYGLFVVHDANTAPHRARDLPKHPPRVPRGCHHLTFVALPDFATLRNTVWRQMELKS